MRRGFLARSTHDKPFLLKPRRRPWQQRQHWLGWGALLCLPPGLALLPTLAYLVVTPRFAHARPLGSVLVALIAAAEVAGVRRLARCVRGEFDLLSALAFGALILLLVILLYTGVFLATVFLTA